MSITKEEIARIISRVQFTCSHCGYDVPWRRPGKRLGRNKYLVPLSYNHCPKCLWSKHTAYEDNEHPVCGGMMKPFVKDEGNRIVHRCLDCGFITDCLSYDAPENAIPQELVPTPKMILGINGDGFPTGDQYLTGNDAVDFRAIERNAR